MTLERPMFPPRADDCQVIEFSSFAAAKSAKQAAAKAEEGAGGMDDYPRTRREKREAKLSEMATAPQDFTETAKNHHLRLSRRDAWWQAGHITDYWRARMDWQCALDTAQTYSVADANSYPKSEDRGRLVDLWRAALVQQMLTPAPDQSAVNWKVAKLRGRNNDFDFPGVKSERLQRAIDADVEWLKAHPSRKSMAATCQAGKAE